MLPATQVSSLGGSQEDVSAERVVLRYTQATRAYVGAAAVADEKGVTHEEAGSGYGKLSWDTDGTGS